MATRCAERLIPFLRIKKRQARLLVLLGKRKAVNRNGRLSPQEVAARQRLRNQVRLLNSTGTAPRIARQRKFKSGSIHQIIEFQGVKKTVKQWAISKGWDTDMLSSRLRTMSIERALTQPFTPRGKYKPRKDGTTGPQTDTQMLPASKLRI